MGHSDKATYDARKTQTQVRFNIPHVQLGILISFYILTGIVYVQLLSL